VLSARLQSVRPVTISRETGSNEEEAHFSSHLICISRLYQRRSSRGARQQQIRNVARIKTSRASTLEAADVADQNMASVWLSFLLCGYIITNSMLYNQSLWSSYIRMSPGYRSAIGRQFAGTVKQSFHAAHQGETLLFTFESFPWPKPPSKQSANAHHVILL
jgi:hypothetical protein